MVENKTSEYCVFVFRRGNSFNGLKLNLDGSIIYVNRENTEYIDALELTIEHKYGDESNSDAYKLLSELFTEGDVLRITSTIDGNVFNKKIEKVTDVNFCVKVKESWDSIKHHWFHPENASNRIEQHIEELFK